MKGTQEWYSTNAFAVVKRWENETEQGAMAAEMLKADNWGWEKIEEHLTNPGGEEKAFRLRKIVDLANLRRRSVRMQVCPGAPATGWPCRDRLCPVCNRKVARKVRKRIRRLYEQMRNPVFITLAYGSRGISDIMEAVDSLTQGFRTLRRRAIWKKTVTGGAGTLEVKLVHAGRWWPHYHLLVDVELAPGDTLESWSARLGSSWRSLTGGSVRKTASMANGTDPAQFHAADDEDEEDDEDGVCAKLIFDAQGLIRYVAKRGPRPGDLSPSKLLYYAAGVKNRRFLLTFGHCHKNAGGQDDQRRSAHQCASRPSCVKLPSPETHLIARPADTPSAPAHPLPQGVSRRLAALYPAPALPPPFG